MIFLAKPYKLNEILLPNIYGRSPKNSTNEIYLVDTSNTDDADIIFFPDLWRGPDEGSLCH